MKTDSMIPTKTTHGSWQHRLLKHYRRKMTKKRKQLERPIIRVEKLLQLKIMRRTRSKKKRMMKIMLFD